MIIAGFTSQTSFWKRMYDAILSKAFGGNYKLIMNPRNCDIYFCTYWDIDKAAQYSNAVVVFVSGEPTIVKWNHIDLLMDCKNAPNLRPANVPTFFLPFYSMSFMERVNHTPKDLIKPPSYNPSFILKTKTQFCAYQYRYNLPHRTALFDLLNTYKPVDALGKSRNKNPNFQFQGSNPYDSSVSRYAPYKFVICCENHSIPGYTTEKMVNAMLANAIPIYWGSPDVVKHFNPKSFVNVQSFANHQKLLDYVKKVDQDDNLFCNILAEPWLQNNQLNEYLNIDQQFEAFATMLKNTRFKPKGGEVNIRRKLPLRNMSQKNISQKNLLKSVSRISLSPRTISFSPRKIPPRKILLGHSRLRRSFSGLIKPRSSRRSSRPIFKPKMRRR